MSLIELMLVTLVGSTIFAISVPAGRSALDSLELGSARQEVGLALQTARLRAVSANRPMRLRLNCPGTGQFRVVEVTGVTSTDSSTTRCDIATFGYPGPRDSDPATPAHDGPVGSLSAKIGSLSGPDLEFSPDGTVRVVVEDDRRRPRERVRRGSDYEDLHQCARTSPASPVTAAEMSAASA